MKTLKDLNQFEQQLEDRIEQKIRKWSRGRLAGVGTFLLALAMVLALLISNKSDQLLSNRERPQAAWNISSGAQSFVASQADTQAVTERYGIPITVVRDHPNADTGLSMNSEVILTGKLAAVAHAFDEYLDAHGEFAIITSGKRTPQNQLDIIKQRIDERNADSKFPNLDEATVADTKIWLRAWHWLIRRHVPVNAPAAVDGADVSMHLKGRAMDFISDNLDQMRAMLAGFARSKYAQEAPLHITAIVREPGCVHINLG
ncbi:MAG TPA: hypothetical protein VFH95_15180 [Candidatus Kapabacteria bacterium]|nr:hypothetical protein [Candidatus Kapabacteria bacterium]